MSEEKVKATENVILDAAMKVFTRRGFAGARMEEIAKEAGINRALLHYYFRDKETMFNLIFETRFKEFFSGIARILSSDLPLFEKIRQMISHEIDTLTKHPDIPRFVIMEVANQPERLIQYGQKMGFNPRQLLTNFTQQVDNAIENKEIVSIDSRQLLMNVMSTCIYPFVAKPIIKTMMQMDEHSFASLMESRKKDLYDFIVKAIIP
ncbi:MAG TPA: helix-turn-helix domain-containing protein [Cyclobacteriaceae bacterium]|nr:helix-turn-helix domain-containing protein [Cyclobacteriaceae bacterium]